MRALLGRHESTFDKRADVVEILPLRTLGLRKCLCVEIEMVKGQPSLASDEEAAFLPTSRDRDEVRGRGQLHVDLELVFDPRQAPATGTSKTSTSIVLVRQPTELRSRRR